MNEKRRLLIVMSIIWITSAVLAVSLFSKYKWEFSDYSDRIAIFTSPVWLYWAYVWANHNKRRIFIVVSIIWTIAALLLDIRLQGDLSYFLHDTSESILIFLVFTSPIWLFWSSAWIWQQQFNNYFDSTSSFDRISNHVLINNIFTNLLIRLLYKASALMMIAGAVMTLFVTAIEAYKYYETWSINPKPELINISNFPPIEDKPIYVSILGGNINLEQSHEELLSKVVFEPSKSSGDLII